MVGRLIEIPGQSSGKHSHDSSAAQILALDKKRVQLYASMAKAGSSLATQIRTEKMVWPSSTRVA